MINFRILLYIAAIASCMLIAIVFGTHQETAVNQIRSKFGVKSDENVILLTTDDDRYTKFLLTLGDEDIDKITASNRSRNKLLVICSEGAHDDFGIKSKRIRIQSHSISKEIEELPELFAVISERTSMSEKIRRSTPMINPLALPHRGEEKNLAGPYLSKIKQNEKDRLRLIQVLTFAFAKHQDLCYTAVHETK